MNASFRARFPSALRAAVDARRQLLEFVERFAFTAQQVADLECAFGEALANAAEHGARDGSTFEVHAYFDGDGVVIEIQDDGPGFPYGNATAVERPPTGAPRGFGIYIMRTLVDEIAYEDHGRRVRLKKRLPHASRSANDACAGG